MSRGWWNVVWIMLVCWGLACSKTDAPTNNSGGNNSAASTSGDNVNNSVGQPKLIPPGPSELDENSGTARATDARDKARGNLKLDDDNPFTEAAAKSPVEEGPPRKNLSGRWILVLTRPGQDGFFDFHVGIVSIAAGEDGANATAKLTSKTEVLPPFKLTESEIKGQSVRLTFDVNGTPLDFRGTLSGGIVHGNALFGNCLPARLLPTQESSLDGFNPSPEPADARALSQAFSLQDPQAALKALAKFCSDRPQSPLGMMAWESRIMIAASQDAATEQIDQLIADYDKAIALWGDRLQQTAKGNLAIIFSQTRYKPEYSLRHVTAAEKAITDESLKDLKEQLQAARESILTAQALNYVESDDPDRAQKAFSYLTRLRTKSPFDPALLYGIGRYHEKSKQTDEAIAIYAEIASLPMLENFLQREWAQRSDGVKRDLPSAALARLWEAKHGMMDGLEEFKDKTYRQRVLAFADKPSTEPPAAGNKLVLCELFTGSSCPPCVGADIATSGLEVTYPKSQVIVLRYHQHIPGPDPLTNADGEDRFTNYYRGQGTPTVLLNGAPVNNVGGYLPNAPDIYRGLRGLVDEQLAKPAKIKVRVNARVVDDVLQVVADAQGLDDNEVKDDLPDLRLRVVIAEDEIHFLARNGVRYHEMIVRRMMGGPGGVEPKDGKLLFRESIPLAELKASLANYLKSFEDSEGIDFPAKPLDLKKLHVVAFVQNDDTHEVLQTSAVAVAATTPTAGTSITPASGKSTTKNAIKPE